MDSALPIVSSVARSPFGALRWSQQLFGTVPDDDDQLQWGNDAWRVDAALGYRFTNYLQAKSQIALDNAASRNNLQQNRPRHLPTVF